MPPRRAAALGTTPRRSTRSRKAEEPIIILDSSPSPTFQKPEPTIKKIISPPLVISSSSPLPAPHVEINLTTKQAPDGAAEFCAETIEIQVPKPARELSRFEREEMENAQASTSRSTVFRIAETPRSKAKAPAITLGDSDDEDDIFDMSKRVAPVIQNRLYSQPARKYVTVASDSSSESEQEQARNGTRKRKKKTSPTKPPIRLRPEPEWARDSQAASVERGESTGRGRTGSTTASPVKATVSGKVQGTKRAVSLTPPPEIDPAQLAAARKRVQEHLVQSIQDEEDDTEVYRRRSASPVRGRIIVISLRMVADPERARNPAMARALKDYCKLRTFRVGLKSPLENMYRTLAERIKKSKDDLVLTYRGQKVASSLLTPEQLGIDGDCTFEAYEKTIYDAIKDQKRKAAEERLARLNAAQESNTSEEDQDQDNKPYMSPVPPPDARLMRLLVRDVNGTEIGMKVKADSLCKNMVGHFCRKAGLPESAAETMRLYIDGEKMEPDEEIGSAGLEAGDVIDVR